MWTQFVIIATITGVSVFGEITAPGIERTVSDGVSSLGYKIVYGDKDMTIINEVVSEVEKTQAQKQKANLIDMIKPLPVEDVKCLMSVDRYCSKKMGEMKSVLIQAIKEDCAKCTSEQKEGAGTVIASMMAHDPVAWKLFLTRSALQLLPRKRVKKREELKLKEVGEPEEVISSSRTRYTKPGVHVRVKRYIAERIP